MQSTTITDIKPNFRFWMPLDKIVKSKDEAGNVSMRLSGLASTPKRDTDNESLNPSGFDISYLKDHGICNWNHNRTDPLAIIGEPLLVEKRKDGLFIETQLYPDNKLAKSVWELAETLDRNSKTRRLGYSIEGRATKRDPNDPTKVTEAYITNYALTISPKNTDSIVNIIKGNFTELSTEELSTESKQLTVEDLVSEVDTLIKAVNETEELPIQTDYKKANGGKSTNLIVDVVRPDMSRITVDSDYNVKISKANSSESSNDQEENEEEKALSTAAGSGQPLIREDLEGAPKITTYSDKNLSKSEGCEFLLSACPVITIEKAIEIYNNVKTSAMATKNKKVTDELLEKALNDLGLEKSHSKKSKKVEDNEEEFEKDDDSDDSDDGMEKGQKKGDSEDQDDEMYDDEDHEQDGRKDEEEDGEDEQEEDDDDESEEDKEGTSAAKKNHKKNEKESDEEDDAEDDEDDEEDLKPVKKGIKKSIKKAIKKSEDESDEEDEEEKPAKKMIKKAEKEMSEKVPEPKLEKAVASEKIEVKNDAVEKMFARLEKSLQQDSIRNRQSFKALGTIMKGIIETTDMLQEQLGSVTGNLSDVTTELSESKDLIKGLEDKLSQFEESTSDQIQKSHDMLEEIGGQAAGQRKSTKSSVKAVEKSFEKGLDTDELGTDVTGGKPTLKVSQNKKRISSMLDNMAFSKGFNPEIAKALTSFEATGTLSNQIAKLIEQANNVRLVA